MVVEFKFPDVGEGIAEGEIVKWMVKEGDKIKTDQHMVDIETDKAVAEIASPKTGTVVKLHYKEGEKVKVGAVIITIAEEGEDVTSIPKHSEKHEEKHMEEKKETKHIEEKHAPTSKTSEEHYTASVVGQIEQGEHLIERHEITQQKAVSNVKATPAVRMFAKQMDVDIEKVKGTGPGGNVTVDDVKKHALLSRNAYVREAVEQSQVDKEEAREITKHKKHEEPKNEEPTAKEVAMAEYNNAAKEETPAGIQAVKKYDFFGYVEHVPVKGIRRAVSTHMRNAADHAVMVTHMDEADITELAELREKEKESLGVHLTFLPFVVKAVIAALKEHPMLNAAMDDEKEEIIVKKYYNIGVAVDTPDGLLVPVIKEAGSLKISDIAKEIERLAKAGADKTIDAMDMKGGTFSITNIGSLGGLYATPVLNYPEAAILGLGRAYDKAMVIDGQIVPRRVLPFFITFDHRVLDGAECARFANKFKEELIKQAKEKID